MRSCLLVIMLIGSFTASMAKEIQPDAIYYPFVVSIDRRPQKDVSYAKCIAGFWNKELSVNFLMATSPTGDRECPGQGDLKFDYTGNQRWERVVGEEGRLISESADVSDFDKKVPYKRGTWSFSILPNRITVKIPSDSDATKIIEDSFCIAHISNKDDDGSILDKTLIACDDCSTLQKCVDTELPIKKPLSIGGKKVETVPHKKESDRNRTH